MRTRQISMDNLTQREKETIRQLRLIDRDARENIIGMLEAQFSAYLIKATNNTSRQKTLRLRMKKAGLSLITCNQ